MMVSAVNIDGLEKMEQMEHLFNDVKYATVSLNKDIRQINEQFDSGIFKLDVTSMKKRLQEEYSELMKPTYEFLTLEGFSLEQSDLAQYLQNNQDILEHSAQYLGNIVAIVRQLSGFGLAKEWTYHSLMELILLFDCVQKDIIPTRYWFDLTKYDFMQELINETQTKVKEFMSASKRLNQSWSREVLEAEKVAALDYYMERKTAGLKLFDINYHKCKKMLRDLFTDEYRTFQDSEIEELNQNLYSIKRNEYWLSKNLSRIQQFWGKGYQETDTDFALLRTQYAIMYRLSAEYTQEDTRKQLITAMLEEESYENLTKIIAQLKEELQSISYQELFAILPCQLEEVEQIRIDLVENTLKRFYEVAKHLSKDFDTLCSFRHLDYAKADFQLEDMRKILYSLERVVQKQDWLKKHQNKIKEVFRKEEITLDTDWNALREKLFRTDRKDIFPVYEIVDKISCLKACGGQPQLVDVLRDVLACESPMKEEVLCKRMVQILELVRMTPKMKAELRELLETELANEYFIEGDFIYSKGEQKLALRIPKEGQEKREIGLIAPMELKAGIVTLLDINYEMTMDEIGKEIASLLGYPRRTKKFNDIVEQAVRELQRIDKINRYSGGFRIQTY